MQAVSPGLGGVKDPTRKCYINIDFFFYKFLLYQQNNDFKMKPKKQSEKYEET